MGRGLVHCETMFFLGDPSLPFCMSVRWGRVIHSQTLDIILTKSLHRHVSGLLFAGIHFVWTRSILVLLADKVVLWMYDFGVLLKWRVFGLFSPWLPNWAFVQWRSLVANKLRDEVCWHSVIFFTYVHILRLSCERPLVYAFPCEYYWNSFLLQGRHCYQLK